METILTETAKQVPALVVLLILCITFAKAGALVVKSFLAQLSETRGDYLTRSSEASAEFLKAIERFHVDNLEARAMNRAAINDNTTAADNQSRALHELTVEVRELRNTLMPVIRKLSDH